MTDDLSFVCPDCGQLFPKVAGYGGEHHTLRCHPCYTAHERRWRAKAGPVSTRNVYGAKRLALRRAAIRRSLSADLASLERS